MLEATGLKAGVDFFLAFSPERVDPGNPKFQTHNVPKVVGGFTPTARRWPAELYGSAIETIVPVSSTRVAEMVKLLENTFRAVNIGLVNELALMCDRMNIDVWEVVDAAKTKPFGFMAVLSRARASAATAFRSIRSISRGRRSRPASIRASSSWPATSTPACRTTSSTRSARRSTRGERRSTARTVLVAGVAYKRDIDDMRESPALDVMGLLHRARREGRPTPIRSCRSARPRVVRAATTCKAVDLTRGAIAQYDCVVIVTDHKAFDYEAMVAEADVVVDTRNAIKQRHAHVFKLGAPHPRAGEQAVIAWRTGQHSALCSSMHMDGCSGRRSLVIFYIYAGLPVTACRVGARSSPAADAAGTVRSRAWPSVSVIVAARNEAAPAPARVANLLDLQYPGQRDIIVVSDGSTDGRAVCFAPSCATTRADVRRHLDRLAGRQAARAQRRRRGRHGRHPRFRRCPAALLRLCRWSSSSRTFADPPVGGVTGELMLDCETGEETAIDIGDGVGLYWKYEKWLRRNESAVLVDARRDRRDLRAAAQSAGVPCRQRPCSTTCWRRCARCSTGYRIVFDERAIAFDRAAGGRGGESRRKTRTLAGNYQILAQEPRLLLPIVNPVWLQYVSHKVGRLVVPWALVTAFVSSCAACFVELALRRGTNCAGGILRISCGGRVDRTT